MDNYSPQTKESAAVDQLRGLHSFFAALLMWSVTDQIRASVKYLDETHVGLRKANWRIISWQFFSKLVTARVSFHHERRQA